jgi:hypothetical protein
VCILAFAVPDSVGEQNFPAKEFPPNEIGKVAFGKKKKRAAPAGASRYWNCVVKIATR